MRLARTVAVVAVVVVSVALGPTGSGGAAVGGSLSLDVAAAGAGDLITVTATGCGTEEEGREVFARLVSGDGAAAVAVGVGFTTGDGSFPIEVPDWYDPGPPARVEAACLGWDGETGEVSQVFTFPDAPVDLLPTAGPPVLTHTVDRTAVAEGQSIHLEGAGCTPSPDREGFVDIVLLRAAATDLSDAVPAPGVGYGSVQVEPDGTWAADVTVLAYDEAVTPGPVVVVVQCGLLLYEPELIELTARNPATASLVAEEVGGEVVVQGSGCTAGAVTVRIFGDELAFARAEARGRGVRNLRAGAARFHDAAPLVTFTVTPATDGSWTGTWPVPEDVWPQLVTATCGDPAADGFAYREAYFDISFGDVWVQRTSPTSARTGEPVDVHLVGTCAEVVTVALRSAGTTVASGSADPFDGYGRARVVAPAQAGRYLVQVRCGDDRAYTADEYEVFDPGAPESPATLPGPEPATGWPSAGPLEHHAGRIGPIWLPAEGSTAPQPPGTRSASALGVALSRPAGDFAIRGIHFDLVDEGGTSVPLEDAHLHHFVMANMASRNAACPNGTFGLPGSIIAAVGQERSQVAFPDPYGQVVRASDTWSGVYDLMNMGTKDRIVYLTYDLDLQRDLSAIRPLTPYFFSATGCSSFTWTIDGSGAPDEQAHYLSMADDGLLVGGGGHVHSGGTATELRDDRGRLVCRSELQVGEVPHGHGHARATEATTTSPAEPAWEEIPEFYEDDPVIEGITSCGRMSRPVVQGERLRFSAHYTNERPRSGVMGIGMFYAWHGGGPAAPTAAVAPQAPPGSVPESPRARPLSRTARFTG